jgi:hypothetical protein
LDTYGDGLPDYVKDGNGNGVFDSGDFANWLDPFNIYDQGTSVMGWTPQHLRLGCWRFNSSSLKNEAGIGPITAVNYSQPNDWSGYAVGITNTDSYLTYPVTSGEQNLFNPANGTIRFWFQPNWSNGSTNEPTNGWQYFFQTGGADGGSYFGIEPMGTNQPQNQYLIYFVTCNNQFSQQFSFGTGALNGAPIIFQSNLWYQFALSYSPSNIALYTNGALLATGNSSPVLLTNDTPYYQLGNGVCCFPPASSLVNGFSFGTMAGQPCAVFGQLDELETFNYPMTAEAVAAGYPNFGGNSTNMLDTYYVGRSDMLQSYVDGVFPPTNFATVAQCRLGYWRFDSETLMAEQGQIPLSVNDVSLVPSWSGTALNINSDPASHVTYWDVFTNGWANINCRQGSLRFWFKPNGTGWHTGPFVYMGSPDGRDQWELALTSGGSSISFSTGYNGFKVANLSTNYSLSPTNWTQIVLTYGSDLSSLYINGTLATTGSGVTYWPSLTNRNLGMVIGNDTSYTNSINGQFDEIETFNYELAASDIASNFQTVANVDSDLNGIPDLLEDIHLTNALPFLGTPVVITGTIEAEQFDMGGPGKGYYTGNHNPPSSYRPTGMFITNCDDLGGGYCLDQTSAGDWTQYTINVLVGQNYTIETRVEGIETNGVFECEFTSGSFYTNTGPLVISNTYWTNISSVVYLPAGTNIMKLRCLSPTEPTARMWGNSITSRYIRGGRTAPLGRQLFPSPARA